MTASPSLLSAQRLPNLSRKPYIRLERKKETLKPMTVGIAAIAERKYIVTASDRALTAEITSDDCIFKAEPYHREWSVILSGNDISDIAPILESAKIEFLDKEYPMSEGPLPLTSKKLAAILKDHGYETHPKGMAQPLGVDFRTIQ